MSGFGSGPVFFRMVAEERGGYKKPQRIKSLTKAFEKACVQAGLPGRIPHDLRRSAVRRFGRHGFPRWLRDAARKLDAVNSKRAREDS